MKRSCWWLNFSLVVECVCGLEVLETCPRWLINTTCQEKLTAIFKFPSEHPLRYYEHRNPNYQSGQSYCCFGMLHGAWSYRTHSNLSVLESNMDLIFEASIKKAQKLALQVNRLMSARTLFIIMRGGSSHPPVAAYSMANYPWGPRLQTCYETKIY